MLKSPKIEDFTMHFNFLDYFISYLNMFDMINSKCIKYITNFLIFMISEYPKEMYQKVQLIINYFTKIVNDTV